MPAFKVKQTTRFVHAVGARQEIEKATVNDMMLEAQRPFKATEPKHRRIFIQVASAACAGKYPYC